MNVIRIPWSQNHKLTSNSGSLEMRVLSNKIARTNNRSPEDSPAERLKSFWINFFHGPVLISWSNRGAHKKLQGISSDNVKSDMPLNSFESIGHVNFC